MAKLLLLDCVISVNGVTLSDHADSVTITSSKDLQEITAFGASYKSNLVGLGDATMEVEFQQDFAAASVDATLWPLHSASTVFSVEVRPTSAAVSATNPKYTMAAAVLPEFTPLAGGVGEVSKTSVTFQNAGQTGIVRATA